MLAVLGILLTTACSAETRYVVHADGFDNVKEKGYHQGDTVRVTYTTVADSTEYNFYVSSTDFVVRYDGSLPGYVIEFKMPEHDVSVCVNQRDTVIYELPVKKIIYERQWEQSAKVEITEPEEIEKLMKLLNDIYVTSETVPYSVMDFTDIITVVYHNGNKIRYEFEENCLVRDDGEHFKTVGRLREFREAMNAFIDTEN